MDQYGKSIRAVTYFTPEMAKIVEEERKKTGQSVSSFIFKIMENALIQKEEVVSNGFKTV